MQAAQQQVDVIQPLSWQVVDILIDRLESLIGKKAINVLFQAFGEIDRSVAPDPVIIYQLGNELYDLVGKNGAFALLRQVGREIGGMFTDGKDAESALELLNKTLAELGFAYEIKLDDENAYICKCVFYKFLQEDGYKPVERPVCWTGWGFIEGCLKNVNGAHHIKWEGRDNKAQACRFSVKMTSDDWEP